MTEKKIDKANLASLIEAMMENYTVFAPTDRGGNIRFCEVGRAEDVLLEEDPSKIPPKELLFPQVEKILTVEEGVWREEPYPEEKRIAFGLSPCDCRSLSLLDHVFSGQEFEDPYYLRRRENTLVVALACNTPRPTCFCLPLGGAPFSEEGADSILVELEEDYLLKALTPKGEMLIEEFSHLLGDPAASDAAQREQLRKAAEEAIHSELRLEELNGKLSAGFEHPVWDEVHEKCLGCAACTYLCPTCHCFDITDESDGRMRSWDTCQFALFTLHVSGHNPRSGGKGRMRQRVMHKFSYGPQNFGETFCVGCGRCVQFCPVNLDIRAVINQLSETLEP